LLFLKRYRNQEQTYNLWDHCHDQYQSMHAALRKRWMKVKDSERLYPEDIAKYKEQLPSE